MTSLGGSPSSSQIQIRFVYHQPLPLCPFLSFLHAVKLTLVQEQIECVLVRPDKREHDGATIHQPSKRSKNDDDMVCSSAKSLEKGFVKHCFSLSNPLVLPTTLKLTLKSNNTANTHETTNKMGKVLHLGAPFDQCQHPSGQNGARRESDTGKRCQMSPVAATINASPSQLRNLGYGPSGTKRQTRAPVSDNEHPRSQPKAPFDAAAVEGWGSGGGSEGESRFSSHSPYDTSSASGSWSPLPVGGKKKKYMWPVDKRDDKDASSPVTAKSNRVSFPFSDVLASYMNQQLTFDLRKTRTKRDEKPRGGERAVPCAGCFTRAVKNGGFTCYHQASR